MAEWISVKLWCGLGGIEYSLAQKDKVIENPYNPYAGGGGLAANRNFGSGSSREHAPQALMRYGIHAIVGESFAEIFFGNCTVIGVPCFTLPVEDIDSIQGLVEQTPETVISIDIATGVITVGESSYSAQQPEAVRQAFVTGSWDALATLLEADQEIVDTYNALPYVGGWNPD